MKANHNFGRIIALGACVSLLMLTSGCGSTTTGSNNGGTNNGGSGLSDPDCSTTAELTDDITEDTILSPDDSACLLVSSMIEVSAHLTIEPGVVLKFAENAGLNIKGGKLTAVGSAEHPIIMTGVEQTAGIWTGLQYRGTESGDNALDHVVIEYAGGDTFQGAGAAGLVINSTGINGEPVRVSIDNTTVRHSSALGMYIEPDANITSFENNSLTNNAGAAARVWPSVLTRLDDTSSFDGNDKNYILVSEEEVASGAHTWHAVDVPYHVSGNIKIEDDAHVTISAGAAFEFESNIGINVETGKLTARGTNEQKITFRGEEDTDAFWKGIQYRQTESSDNALVHVIIEHAGGDTFQGAGAAALVLNSSGINGGPIRLLLDNVTIDKFSPEAAVYVEPDATLVSCTGLSGFSADDVIGDGNAAFTATCSL